MITGFLVLIVLYMAYRLNRDEGIIVILQERVAGLENFIQSVPNEVDKISDIEGKIFYVRLESEASGNNCRSSEEKTILLCFAAWLQIV